jgi:hypothetical protein
MLSPYDQKCDDEYDQPEKHPAQQGTECFGYGHGIGGVGHGVITALVVVLCGQTL